MRRYASYLWPQPVTRDVARRLCGAIIDEYSQDNIYTYAYGVGYQDYYPTFDLYMKRIAELVVAGAMNGADDVLTTIYRAFMELTRLAPARRHPRRLKMW